ncbi:MAG: NFACT RNA binding domain-containing protein [Bacillota bacterium]|nr:NFACT RNA binding domain-containing protein [Bacillota bacterium]
MSFDTLIMKVVTDELKDEATGALIQQVYEPSPLEIALHLYYRGRQMNLLFSIESKYARIHLTGESGKRKNQPSPFCMLLRKYLIGGRIASFSNPPLERVMEIEIDPPEGLPPVRIIAEIMSRRSNLILVGGNNDEILGAMKIASWEKNPLRAIMPGEKYRPVPRQDKLDPLRMEESEFISNFENILKEISKPEKALYSAVEGISPLIARELVFRSKWDNRKQPEVLKSLYRETQKLFNELDSGQVQPVLIPEFGIYAAVPLMHLNNDGTRYFESVNELLDQFYSVQIREEREKQLKESLNSAVNRKLSSLQYKKRELDKELAASAKAPELRQYGELLLAYGDRVEKGAESVALPDLYNPDQLIVIPLNPAKNAGANARYYFNRYRKAKNSRDQIRKQLNKTKSEIDYCLNLLYSIENGSGISLIEITQELIEAGYLKKKEKGKRKSDELPKPLTFKSSSGNSILVGRNNRQNDYITFKAAVRRDTWFHVRQLPGSHVVLKGVSFPPPQQDLEEAAFLAAYFSKGRESSAVAVDYTEVRHVRRRAGGKPGFVFYENFETITVNPGNEELQALFKL